MNYINILILAFISMVSANNNCTIREFSQVTEIVKECSNIVIEDLVVPAYSTLLLNLQNRSMVTFTGNVVFEVGYWEGPLLEISGDGVKVQGTAGHVINAQGEKYWDGQGGSGGVTKPRFVVISTTGGSVFKDIYLLNCVYFCVGIKATDLTLSGWTIDVVAGNTRGGLNTDGFGIGNGQNILIENSVVMNQDDCVVVNSGSDMVFRNLECYGSHGLSFSVGNSNNDNAASGTIRNITFTDCLVANGLYGIHVKTKKGTGILTDVTYENIRLSGITEDGIYINQDYGDIGNYSREIQIRNLKMSNIYGSVQGVLTRPVHVVCNNDKCHNWTWSNINILGGGKNYCNFQPTEFTC
ncbi:polygalacturonase-like [Diabrotica undecimpunctata]|uniref:polygalacturonase-like n=1 Tax=Diabrotica undecimpunctata TaxID=50387 RepID=UPI003B640402